MGRAATKDRPGASKLGEPKPKEMTVISPEGEEVTMRYMFVDPDVAQGFLENNPKNRTISGRLVDQYARVILHDQWPLLGDCLCISDEGLVLQGQHRAKAIVKSGKGLWMWVVFGLSEWKRRFFDIGRKRSPADYLKMAGMPYANDAASCARLLLMWEGWRSGNSSINPGNSEQTQYAEDNEGAVQRALYYARLVRFGVRQRVEGGYIYGVAMNALSAAFIRAQEVSGGDPFPIARFMTRLAKGEMLEAGEPVLALRRAIQNSPGAEFQPDLYKIVTAWNDTQDGKWVKQIALPPRGIKTIRFPDMKPPRKQDGEPLTKLDEEVAEALQHLREKKGA